jgi:hypothetical protein
MNKYVTHKREVKGAITHLKVDGAGKSRKEIMDDIPANDYFTYVNDKIGAKIHKTKNGYLTTNPNDDTRDNLDNLPTF